MCTKITGDMGLPQKMILNIHTKEATKTPNKFLNKKEIFCIDFPFFSSCVNYI